MTELIDLNSAKRDKLAELPMIGPKLAAKIIKERRRRKGFTGFWELSQILGISRERVRVLKQFARIGPKTKKVAKGTAVPSSSPTELSKTHAAAGSTEPTP